LRGQRGQIQDVRQRVLKAGFLRRPVIAGYLNLATWLVTRLFSPAALCLGTTDGLRHTVGAKTGLNSLPASSCRIGSFPYAPLDLLEPRSGIGTVNYSSQEAYALVRHPIYTGLLLAFVGSAVARGEWRGLLAVALVFVALWRKLRLEEKWMRAQFGESYAAYSRRVAALVPHVI